MTWHAVVLLLGDFGPRQLAITIINYTACFHIICF